MINVLKNIVIYITFFLNGELLLKKEPSKTLADPNDPLHITNDF